MVTRSLTSLFQYPLFYWQAMSHADDIIFHLFRSQKTQGLILRKYFGGMHTRGWRQPASSRANKVFQSAPAAYFSPISLSGSIIMLCPRCGSGYWLRSDGFLPRSPRGRRRKKYMLAWADNECSRLGLMRTYKHAFLRPAHHAGETKTSPELLQDLYHYPRSPSRVSSGARPASQRMGFLSEMRAHTQTMGRFFSFMCPRTSFLKAFSHLGEFLPKVLLFPPARSQGKCATHMLNMWTELNKYRNS